MESEGRKQQRIAASSQRQHNIEDQPQHDEDEQIDLEKVKEDAANDAVAMSLFVAMGFFVIVFATAMGLTLLFVQQYGLVATAAVLTLMFVMVVLSAVIYRAVTEEKQLRKAHKNIVYWKEVAKQVIVNEINAFQDEMNDHLRLTNGEESKYYDDNDSDRYGTADYVAMSNIDDRNPSDSFMDTKHDNMRQLPSLDSNQTRSSEGSNKSSSKQRRKRKSVLFGMIKPFLSSSKSKEADIPTSKQNLDTSSKRFPNAARRDTQQLRKSGLKE